MRRAARVVTGVLVGAALPLSFVVIERAAAQSPAYRVSFDVTGVSKSRPPNIVETRLAGRGVLSFDTSPPTTGDFVEANSASGKVVVEYDILSPHPRTEQVTFALSKSVKPVYGVSQASNGTRRNEAVHMHLVVTASTSACAFVGETATLTVVRDYLHNKVGYNLSVGRCGTITVKSGTTRNSRIHVRFSGACLRPHAAALGKPICGAGSTTTTTTSTRTTTSTTTSTSSTSALPTRATIGTNGATRGETIATGALDCGGSGYPEGTSCFVNAVIGNSITLTATLDKPLPPGWSWKITWPDDATTAKDCGAGGTSCTTSVTVTQVGGFAGAAVTTPNGTAALALTVQSCNPGETPNGHPCPSS
jgi:hypothetical protein